MSVQLFGFLFVFLLFTNKTYADKDLLKASSGIPSIVRDKYLPEESFVPVTAKKLKYAQVAWVNFDLLREMGFKVPAEGLTPAFEKTLIDAFGYMIPGPTSNEANFVPDSKKTFYADIYGGEGIGWGKGSGRAAAAGKFQIKGIGLTPLLMDPKSEQESRNDLGPWDRFKEWLDYKFHTTGDASLRESIHEAIWGEVLHRQLPHGANRVACIISTGLSGSKSGVEPTGLIVRENSVRPAHYMRNGQNEREDLNLEKMRVQKLMPYFLESLRANYGTKIETPEDLKLALNKMIDRIAENFGAEYGQSIHHGSMSPSNIDVSGQALDHGPLTALNGFSKLILKDDYPNGDYRSFLPGVLSDFIKDLRASMPSELKEGVITQKELTTAFKAGYEKGFQRQLLFRFGLPELLIERVHKSGLANDLLKVLKEIAEDGNTKIYSRLTDDIPVKSGTYDFVKVMSETHASIGKFRVVTTETLPELQKNHELNERYVKAVNSLLSELFPLASEISLDKQSLLKFMSEASAARNRPRTDLITNRSFFMSIYTMLAKFKVTNNFSEIRTYISNTLSNSINRVEKLSPWQVVKKVFYRDNGNFEIESFNAKESQSLIINGNELRDEEFKWEKYNSNMKTKMLPTSCKDLFL